MHASSSHPIPRHRLVWLLWIALLLPMAQAAASWHVLSHSAWVASDAVEGKQAPHQTHCDLCLTAAAVSGGALRAEPPALSDSAARYELPLSTLSGVGSARSIPAYRSRAPPPASA